MSAQREPVSTGQCAQLSLTRCVKEMNPCSAEMSSSTSWNRALPLTPSYEYERCTRRALSSCGTWINTVGSFSGNTRCIRRLAGRGCWWTLCSRGFLCGRKGVWWMEKEPLKWHWQKGRKSDCHPDRGKCMRNDGPGLQKVKCSNLGGINGKQGI